jgi:hypothetical protein
MEILRFGIMKSDIRYPKTEIQNPKFLAPVPALPSADAFAGFLGVPGAA